MADVLVQRVLLDTGPLVAILNRGDSQHERCVSALKMIRPPLLTSWPVMTEAAWLLRNHHDLLTGLYALAARRVLEIQEISHDELPALQKLMNRYQSLSPQLADLSLVHLAQRDGLDTVLTLDRRDFSVYRRKGRAAFRLLPEDV
ncbi:MAG: PIN domain-containing protein [Planctomycetales bacterium]|nr:PIN domain-containing protein [Planctomycetales bacterium]